MSDDNERPDDELEPDDDGQGEALDPQLTKGFSDMIRAHVREGVDDLWTSSIKPALLAFGEDINRRTDEQIAALAARIDGGAVAAGPTPDEINAARAALEGAPSVDPSPAPGAGGASDMARAAAANMIESAVSNPFEALARLVDVFLKFRAPKEPDIFEYAQTLAETSPMKAAIIGQMLSPQEPLAERLPIILAENSAATVKEMAKVYAKSEAAAPGDATAPFGEPLPSSSTDSGEPETTPHGAGDLTLTAANSTVHDSRDTAQGTARAGGRSKWSIASEQ